MNFTPEQIEQLSAKLSGEAVKTRTQAGRTLSYIEGWHAEAEANRIFGFDGWERETIYCKEVCRYEQKKSSGAGTNWKVGYEAKVRVSVRGVVREGTGHGAGTMGDLYDAIESAAKEAETDAMKRALKTFGNPFGLALYDKTHENVEPAAPKTAAPTATEPAYSQDDLKTFATSMQQALESARDIAALDDIMKRNNDKLKAMKTLAMPEFEATVAVASKRKEFLNNQKAA